MKDFFDTIQTISEFVLLGGMITVTMAYGFIWIHPVRDSLVSYYKDSRAFLLGAGKRMRAPDDSARESSHLRTVIVTALSVGYLYVAGSVGNALGYWLMEPGHNAFLATYYSRAKSSPPDCASRADLSREIPLIDWLLLKRIAWDRGTLDCEQAVYETTLLDEAEWRTYDRQSADDELDGLVKHIRLSRGAALCALALTLMAILKLIGSLVVFSVPGSRKKWLYTRLIDKRMPKRPSRTIMRAAGVYLVTTFAAAALYSGSLMAYLNTEREYHGFAHFGARNALEKFQYQITHAAVGTDHKQ